MTSQKHGPRCGYLRVLFGPRWRVFRIRKLAVAAAQLGHLSTRVLKAADRQWHQRRGCGEQCAILIDKHPGLSDLQE